MINFFSLNDLMEDTLSVKSSDSTAVSDEYEFIGPTVHVSWSSLIIFYTLLYIFSSFVSNSTNFLKEWYNFCQPALKKY